MVMDQALSSWCLPVVGSLGFVGSLLSPSCGLDWWLRRMSCDLPMLGCDNGWYLVGDEGCGCSGVFSSRAVVWVSLVTIRMRFGRVRRGEFCCLSWLRLEVWRLGDSFDRWRDAAYGFAVKVKLWLLFVSEAEGKIWISSLAKSDLM